MILTPMKPCMITTPSSLNATAIRNYKHHKKFTFPRYCGSTTTICTSWWYSDHQWVLYFGFYNYRLSSYHPTPLVKQHKLIMKLLKQGFTEILISLSFKGLRDFPLVYNSIDKFLNHLSRDLIQLQGYFAIMETNTVPCQLIQDNWLTVENTIISR